MKAKSSPKGVRQIEFWKGYEEIVSPAVKQLTYQHYYSQDTLHVYCDTSTQPERSTMAVACSYVRNTNVTVKVKYVYPTRDVANKNIFGELQALLFALKHVHQYEGSCTSIMLYSDVHNVEELLTKQACFQHPTLQKVQNELIASYRQKQSHYLQKDIRIVYLSSDLRKHNPFHKSAHNAAKRLLIR